MERRKALLSEICSLVGVKFVGKDIEINGLNLCNRTSQYESILGYTTSPKFFDAIIANPAVKALVLTGDLYELFEPISIENKRSFAYVINPQPECLFYDIHNTLWNNTNFYDKHQQDTIIGEECDIHPSVVVEKGVVIGNHVKIGPNSVVRGGSIIDDNVEIGCCSVIGSEGFQGIKGYNIMVKHVGGTHLCHDVYVGDCSTVGNALFEGCSEIGAYSKLDNHIHFAHNCKCGEHCIITACSLLMGSTTLENNVWMAPNAVTMNGVHVFDNGFIGAMSMAKYDVNKEEVVVGIPAKVLKK